MQHLFEYERTHRTTLMRDVAKYVGQGLFIHFGDSPKLGINPKATHGDPHGVYFYPLDWLVTQQRFVDGNQYATERDFWSIVRLTGTEGIRFSRLTMEKVDEYADRLNWKLWDDFKQSNTAPDMPAGAAAMLWQYLTHLHNRKMSPNAALRGVQFIYDDGYGIIHSSEKSQLLVIDPRAMQIVATGEQKSGSNKLMNDHQHAFLDLCKMLRGEYGGTLLWKNRIPTLAFEHRGAKFDLSWFPSSFAGHLKMDARWGRATKQIHMTEHLFRQTPMAEVRKFFEDFIARISTFAAKKRDLFFTPIMTEQQCLDGLKEWMVDPKQFVFETEINNERHEMTVTATREVKLGPLTFTVMVYVLNGDETFADKGIGDVRWSANIKSQPYALASARTMHRDRLMTGLEETFQETIGNVAKNSEGSPKFYYDDTHQAFVGMIAKESGLKSMQEDHAEDIAFYEEYTNKMEVYRETKRVF